VSISPTCLRKAFTYADSKSATRHLGHLCSFALWVSALVKAARKMFVKLTPGVREPGVREIFFT